MFERRWGLVPFVLTGVLAVGCAGQAAVPVSGAASGPGLAPVADLAALTLVSGPSEHVVARDGVAVVPACAVASIEDVRAAGLPVLATPLTSAMRRVRLDDAVLAAGPPAQPLPAEINTCWYALESQGRRGSVRATVLQPALFGRDTTLDGQAAPPIAGVDVRLVHAGTADHPRSVHVLRHGGTVVELVVEHLDAESSRALTVAAATRLAALSGAPAGQPTFRHASGVLPGAHADACALTSGSAVPDAFSGVSLPLVSERLASTVGAIESSGRRHTYVGHRCVRSPLDTPSRGRDLNVHTATFSHAGAARSAFDALAGRPGVERVAASERIGDAAVRGDLPDLDDALAFRVGRVIVHVSGARGTAPTAALARTIAARLGGQA